MVIRLFLIGWLFFLGALNAEEIKVTADVEPASALPGQPIKGLLTIIHPPQMLIDEKTATLGGSPLTLTLEQTVSLSAGKGGEMSIYSFTLPAQEKGLHELQEISVTIGNKVYRSVRSTYTVADPTNTRTSSPSSSTYRPSPAPYQRQSSQSAKSGGYPPAGYKAVAELKLEAFAEGEQPFFVGQRFRVGYRYIYKGDIELTTERLPLFESKDFTKVSDRSIKDFERGGYSVREISQEVEAQKAGDFSIGPSLIEGPFFIRQYGQKIYGENKIRAQAPAVHLVVKDLPKNKPPSFNGAVGRDLSFKAQLISKPQVNVGDSITLQLEIRGKGDLKTIPMPDLCCQPGFSGLFKSDDLPPVGIVKGDTKVFEVHLRPLSDQIKAIPQIEFTYFNPTQERYISVKSASIPIEVVPLKAPPLENRDEKVNKEPSEPAQEVKAIEIEGNYPLTNRDLHNLPLGSWWALIALPLGAILFAAEWGIRAEIVRMRTRIKIKSGQELMEEAVAMRADPAACVRLITDALIRQLVENGELKQGNYTGESLPSKGNALVVKEFLQRLERERFTGKEVEITDSFLRQATSLLHTLKGEVDEQK